MMDKSKKYLNEDEDITHMYPCFIAVKIRVRGRVRMN